MVLWLSKRNVIRRRFKAKWLYLDGMLSKMKYSWSGDIIFKEIRLLWFLVIRIRSPLCIYRLRIAHDCWSSVKGSFTEWIIISIKSSVNSLPALVYSDLIQIAQKASISLKWVLVCLAVSIDPFLFLLTVLQWHVIHFPYERFSIVPFHCYQL